MLKPVYTPALDRNVWLREGNDADSQVWADTFTGLYHLPPEGTPAPRTVLDAGANIGLTTAHFQKVWPDAEVVAVEMDDTNVGLARKNAPDARVWNCAVAAAAGPAFYDRAVGTNAFALGSGSRQVECVSLGSLLELSFDSHPIDFLKLDIEGMEWSLFAFPSWAPLVRTLVVELHGVPLGLIDGRDAGALIDLAIPQLEAAGYAARAHPRHPQAVYAEAAR